ncbi:hypothetical protein B0O99DRAFT_680934 [Bisporella sp. PMI_857]|nr:hypothetical protein B0O99DRAFT_680934 [Bisporella sp. PMI_857]
MESTNLVRNTPEAGESALSCQRCRKRKIKCDRVLPSCKTCIDREATCCYPETAQKPGPKAGTIRRKPKTEAKSLGRQQEVRKSLAERDHDVDSLGDWDTLELNMHCQPTFGLISIKPPISRSVAPAAFQDDPVMWDPVIPMGASEGSHGYTSVSDTAEFFNNHAVNLSTLHTGWASYSAN